MQHDRPTRAETTPAACAVAANPLPLLGPAIIATLLALAALLAAAPLAGQQPLGQPVDEAPAVAAQELAVQDPDACPAVDPADGREIEIRVAGHVLRAQVRDAAPARADGAPGEAAEPRSAGVRVRLVGCEERPAAGGGAEDAEAAAADVAADAAGEGPAGAPRDAAGSGLLRLIHDLRLGVELGTSEDGRCVQATFSVDDGTRTAPGVNTPAGEPVAFQLCGLPFLDPGAN